ncbi:MAG: 30S ribosomal protein S7 [Candidatus Uhrbacteria bacterium]
MRGKSASARDIAPDAKFGNAQVAKFINYIMEDGKKTVAQAIVYTAFDIISEKTKADPVEIFENAVKNTSPSLEVKSKRVGGANYQIPMPVRGERRLALSFRWILDVARAKKGRPMAQKLADELMAAAKGEGDAFKKKADVQRMAEANKAFAHFAR